MARRTLKSTTSNGSRLEQLENLALLLAEQMDSDIEPRVVAPIARQYRETIKEIDELRNLEDDDDELEKIRQRRTARKS